MLNQFPFWQWRVGLTILLKPKHRVRGTVLSPSLHQRVTAIMAQESPSNPPPPPQWVLDLNSPLRPKTRNTNITNPPGYTEASSGKVQPLCSQSISSCLQLTALAAYCHLIQNSSPQTPNDRGNRHAEAEKVLGTRPRACQSLAHERNHDVHVGQLAADIQHNDGLHAVQEPYHGHLYYE